MAVVDEYILQLTGKDNGVKKMLSNVGKAANSAATQVRKLNAEMKKAAKGVIRDIKGKMKPSLGAGGNKPFFDVVGDQKRQDDYWKRYMANVKGAEKVTKGATKRMKQHFSMWALGVMFFGMMIQKAFLGIAKQAFKTFNDVIHSTEGMITPMDILSAQWQAIKFTIGEALAPIVAGLIPVIMKIRDWIETHKELTGKLIKFGVIIGTLLYLFGTFWLGIQAISTAVKVLTGGIGLLKGAFVGLKTVLAFLAANPIILMIAGFVAVGIAILKLKDALGGWGEFFKSVLRGILRVLVFFAQGIFDLLILPIKTAIKLVNDLINGWNEFWGTSHKTIEMPAWMEDPTHFVKKYLEWEADSSIARDSPTKKEQEQAAANAAMAQAAEAGVAAPGSGGTTVNIYGISDEEAQRLLGQYTNPTRI